MIWNDGFCCFQPLKCVHMFLDIGLWTFFTTFKEFMDSKTVFKKNVYNLCTGLDIKKKKKLKQLCKV